MNMARRRCARLIFSISDADSFIMSVYPSAAAAMVEMVEAIPLVVKVALYGAAGPVSRSIKS